MPGSGALRRQLVSQLEEAGAIRTTAVRDAFRTVPRETFVPEAAAERGLDAIYEDDVVITKRDPMGVPISSSSQPQIMAIMLELLRLDPGHRVLEIGAGTGYNAALLAELVGDRGRVVSVELDRDLARRARDHLAAAGGRAATVRVQRADGRLGAPKHAPFDRIIATASVPRVPTAWRDQLRPDGILVAPVWLEEHFSRQVVASFQRHASGLRSEQVVPGGFMGLRHDAGGIRPDPSAVVQAGWRVDGRGSMVGLEGDVVRRMTAAARRRLAAVLAEEPRRLRLGRFAQTLPAYLPIPPSSLAVWSRDSRIFVAIATVDGRSVAGVGRGAKGRNVAIAAGTEAAEERLRRALERARVDLARGIGPVLVADGDDELTITRHWAKL